MRFILATVLILFSISAFAQSWKTEYITSNGDTIKAGKTKVKILPASSITYIYPNTYKEPGQTVESLERKKRYLVVNMTGNTYTIDRLSRIPVGSRKAYKEIAAITIGDYHADPLSNVEYIIMIDDAMAAKEIEIIN